MNRILPILCFLLLAFNASADRVKVRLFSNNSIDLINISFDLGTYNIYSDDTTLIEENVGNDKAVELTTQGRKVHVAINGYDYGSHTTVNFRATDTACILCLNPRNIKQRTYEGNLSVNVNKRGHLQIINDVEFETYIAGVVQSEIYGTDPDIFRVQAIISRTWAMKNINKHTSEGYNFCDQVHCQAYLNRCVRPDIMLGTMLSSGMTIVDSTGHLIETPFHANSGGQTANSEDVWRAAVPYLRSVPDTFSYGMRQSEWVKVINEDKWLNYFANKHKLNIADDSIRNELLTFSQSSASATYPSPAYATTSSCAPPSSPCSTTAPPTASPSPVTALAMEWVSARKAPSAWSASASATTASSGTTTPEPSYSTTRPIPTPTSKTT